MCDFPCNLKCELKNINLEGVKDNKFCFNVLLDTKNWPNRKK